MQQDTASARQPSNVPGDAPKDGGRHWYCQSSGCNSDAERGEETDGTDASATIFTRRQYAHTPRIPQYQHHADDH